MILLGPFLFRVFYDSLSRTTRGMKQEIAFSSAKQQRFISQLSLERLQREDGKGRLESRLEVESEQFSPLFQIGTLAKAMLRALGARRCPNKKQPATSTGCLWRVSPRQHAILLARDSQISCQHMNDFSKLGFVGLFTLCHHVSVLPCV